MHRRTDQQARTESVRFPRIPDITWEPFVDLEDLEGLQEALETTGCDVALHQSFSPTTGPDRPDVIVRVLLDEAARGDRRCVRYCFRCVGENPLEGARPGQGRVVIFGPHDEVLREVIVESDGVVVEAASD